MKTCSAILQTLLLMKGSLSLCSLHTYNECGAAIIKFHLHASLISWPCFLAPTLATGELSSQGSYTTLLGAINKAWFFKTVSENTENLKIKMAEWLNQVYVDGDDGDIRIWFA